jgi:hypothetical protein
MKKPIFNIISANRPKFLNRPILDDSKKLILRSKVSYFSACTLCTNVNGVRKHNQISLPGSCGAQKSFFLVFTASVKTLFKTFFAVSVQTHD